MLDYLLKLIVICISTACFVMGTGGVVRLGFC